MPQKKKTERDLVSYLSRSDVEVVLGRVPEEHHGRLRDVFFSYRSRGVRRLGAVQTRGRRDIDLYSVLPPRVSLGRFLAKGQSAADFGAAARYQWPPWAVRRFLLYDVLLHELGHLQLVNSKTDNWKRRYAGETLAQRFADRWRKELWATPFGHPDPVHNPPTSAELAFLEVWKRLSKAHRYQLVVIALRLPGLPSLPMLGELDDEQRRFVEHAL